MLYRENIKKPIIAVMTFVMMALCGCIDIPARHLIERQRGSVHTMHTVGCCDMDEVIKPRATTLAPAA